MIRFESVKKSFGEKCVLDNLSLAIEPGEIVFVIGRSGTGKSVLLKHIVGLLKPDSGRVWVGDTEVSELSEEALLPIRRRCGYVFQSPALLDSLTVFENVAFGLRARSERISESDIREKVVTTLRRLRLSDNILEKLPSELSFGMQKRVGIARTIALDPQCLLYDEPTTGLEPVTTNVVTTLTEEIARSLHVTSIVVSHDMQCGLSIADRIVMLDAGKVVAMGSPKQMLESDVPLVREFLREAKERTR